MNTFLRSTEFDAWLAALKDRVGRARIVHRIRSAEHVHFGPGYRVYFTRRSEVVYFLLVGGDKSSQKRDIQRAIVMAQSLDKD